MGILSRLRGSQSPGNSAKPNPYDSSSDREKEYPVQSDALNRAVYDDDLHVPTLVHTTERKLMFKIDLFVIPCLCVLYLLAFLDRVNISNARLFGMENTRPGEDGSILLKGTNQFNVALVIFFVPYVLFEIPSNVLLKKFSPRIWLSGCMVFFGFVTMTQGLAQSYGGLLAARFFLGVAETGMFPGCFYLISMWYKRAEAQRRYSFFFSSTTLAGAFGGLLAAAIGKMDGLRDYRAWRWIFILEGTLTCVVGILFFFIMPNFPEQAKWLSDEEREYVKARLRADQGRAATERSITLRDVGRVFKDFKVYIGGLMYFGLIVPAYGYAYFSPTIIKTYGYGNIKTNLYSVAPWAGAFFFAMCVATVSDLTRHRFLFTLLPICVAIAGFGILLAVHNNTSLQYAALFLCAAGTYSAMPVIVCWFQMNLGGHHRRAVGTGWQVGFGNIGGIIAVFAFLPKDSPRFVPGYSICMAFIVLSVLSCCAYFAACLVQNRRRDRQPAALDLSERDKTELGDMSPDYRYQL